MKRFHLSPNEKTEASWQISGELELPVGSAADEHMETWLEELLSRLNMQADLVNKIRKSAQEAMARSGSPEEQTGGYRSVHLLVLIPAEYASNGQTWGFFRIEKVDVERTNDGFQRYVIEFYLYLEN